MTALGLAILAGVTFHTISQAIPDDGQKRSAYHKTLTLISAGNIVALILIAIG